MVRKLVFSHVIVKGTYPCRLIGAATVSFRLLLTWLFQKLTSYWIDTKAKSCLYFPKNITNRAYLKWVGHSNKYPKNIFSYVLTENFEKLSHNFSCSSIVSFWTCLLSFFHWLYLSLGFVMWWLTDGENHGLEYTIILLFLSTFYRALWCWYPSLRRHLCAVSRRILQNFTSEPVSAMSIDRNHNIHSWSSQFKQLLW